MILKENTVKNYWFTGCPNFVLKKTTVSARFCKDQISKIKLYQI